MAYEVINALFYEKKPLFELIRPSQEWRPLLEANNKLVKEAHRYGMYNFQQRNDIEMNSNSNQFAQKY
jgi:hypothetical protein